MSDRDESLGGLLEQLQKAIEINLEKKLPCIVKSVSSDRQRVVVQPLIAIVGEDGSTVARDSIADVPVYQMGAGNLLISCPVKVNDIGWLEACDRDISLYLQSYSATKPATFRRHSFSDAVFYPDIQTDFTIQGEDADAVTIQSRDGSVKVAVDESEVRVKSGGVSLVVDGSAVTVTNGGSTFIVTGSSIAGASPTIDLNGFVIGSDGAAESPASITAANLTAPSIAATGSLTNNGREAQLV